MRRTDVTVDDEPIHQGLSEETADRVYETLLAVGFAE